MLYVRENELELAKRLTQLERLIEKEKQLDPLNYELSNNYIELVLIHKFVVHDLNSYV